MSESLFFQDLAVLMTAVGFVSVVFTRLGWPKVIGYLLAGILMSSNTWGGSFLADTKSIATIGQMGVVFLMFTLGLEFSADDMKKVKHVSVPTAVFDMGMMMWLGYMAGHSLLGWGTVPSLFLGAALSDSATTLLAKTIEEMRWSDRPFTRFIFGTTICEDIMCVGVIALVTGVAKGDGMSVGDVGMSLGGLLAFFTAVLVFGLVLVPRLLNQVARLKDDEALLLTLLGLCFLISYVAFKLDFTLALGAFLVGILGASSDARARLHALAAPLRNMFAAMFFVTIGLLVNPAACWHNLGAILGLTLLVMCGKGLNCFLLSVLTGQTVKDAVQTGMGLAQIGEFAYMVALLYMTQTGDVTNPMFQIVVGVSLVTTLLNPTMLRLSDPAGDWVETHLPLRVRGVLSAYDAWLRRFRSARMSTQLQQHLYSRVRWLTVIAVLNFCVSFAASLLSGLNYTAFSRFFEENKQFFFCLGASLFCVSMLAPMSGLAVALGRDVAAVLTGTRDAKRWRKAVQQFLAWVTWAAVMLLAFVQLVMINVSLFPTGLVTRGVMLLLLGTAAVLGWRRFKRAGRVAGYRFGSAVAAERRRVRAAAAKKARTSETAAAAEAAGGLLAMPGDYYARVTVAAASPAVGETIRSLDVRAKTGASILEIARGGERFHNPRPTWSFEAGDELSVIGEPGNIAALRALFGEDTAGARG